MYSARNWEVHLYFLTMIQFQVRASFVVAHNASDVGSDLEICPPDFVFHSGNMCAGVLHIRHDRIIPSFTRLIIAFVSINLPSLLNYVSTETRTKQILFCS